jgi:glycosyltransferase involved in cell wall biosynthesis
LSYWRTFTGLKPSTIVFVKGWMEAYPLRAYLAARFSGARRVFAIEHLIADPAPMKITEDGAWAYLRQIAGWRARYIWRMRLPGILSHQTICVSNAIRERLVHEYGYPSCKTVTIRNGVDLKYYDASLGHSWQCLDRSSLDIGPHDAIIVCVARLARPKRIDVLLEAMALVAKAHPSCKCLVVGAGPLEEELRARSIVLGLSASVRFVGHVEDVRPYLAVADLFVLPSEREGLPLSVLEAMAFGVPCIATDVGGNREVIVHGQTGLIIKPEAPEQLAQAIDFLLVHEEERCRMGRNGKDRAQEFNGPDMMRQLLDVLLGRGVGERGIPLVG